MEQAESKRKEIMELMQQREFMETELEAITEILNSPPSEGVQPVGLSGNLVDKEGFPRADIDIMAIRGLRNRRAILQTDHMNLMSEIEAKLIELHDFVAREGISISAPNSASSSKTSEEYQEEEIKDGQLVPFAEIDEVSDGAHYPLCPPLFFVCS